MFTDPVKSARILLVLGLILLAAGIWVLIVGMEKAESPVIALGLLLMAGQPVTIAVITKIHQRME